MSIERVTRWWRGRIKGPCDEACCCWPIARARYAKQDLIGQQRAAEVKSLTRAARQYAASQAAATDLLATMERRMAAAAHLIRAEEIEWVPVKEKTRNG